jgi:hypothetical protein
MKQMITGLVLFAAITTSAQDSEVISLSSFLDRIKTEHPFFRQAELEYEIAWKIQERFLGDQDWRLRAVPAATYDDTVEIGVGAPDVIRNARMEVGADRQFWSTGGRFDLTYATDALDQEFDGPGVSLPGAGESLNFGGPPEFFRRGVSASYTQPLLQNRGGGIDRLPYDLSGYSAAQSEYFSHENQEDFLLGLGIQFLEWMLLDEERTIAERRRKLAQEEFESTERRLQANVVEKVDFYRAKDAVLESERNLKLIESSWSAKQVELSVQAMSPEIMMQRPEYELYQFITLPDANDIVAELRVKSRLLAGRQAWIDQIEREADSLKDTGKAELDLSVAGGLKSGDETYGDSFDFDRPDVTVALTYRYPLGNRTARADLERNALEWHQAREQYDDEALGLETEARSLLTRLGKLEEALALNREQLQTAADKTGAEVRLYEQGRSQLTFVIQSRDAEAFAQLVYARSATEYHSLWLQLREVMDELLPSAPSARVEGMR